jgi:hypothetical protein
MDVVVTKECPRCGKKSDVAVALEVAVAMDQKRKEKENETAALELDLAETLGNMQNKPLLLVAALNADGATYTVKAMSDLCSGQRSCTSRITTLLNEVFVPVKQVVKKKEVPNEREMTDPPAMTLEELRAGGPARMSEDDNG